MPKSWFLLRSLTGRPMGTSCTWGPPRGAGVSLCGLPGKRDIARPLCKVPSGAMASKFAPLRACAHHVSVRKHEGEQGPKQERVPAKLVPGLPFVRWRGRSLLNARSNDQWVRFNGGRCCAAGSFNGVAGMGQWGDKLGEEMWKRNVDEYLSQLSPEQLAAVEQKGKLVRLIAGPGSGKTRVLTARVAKLLAQGAAPHNILIVTFTNKAAAEIRTRLIDLLGSSIGGSKSLWAGTFHSTASKILRQHIHRLGDGLGPDYTIVDEGDSMKVIAALLQQHRPQPQAPMDSPESVKNFKKQVRTFKMQIRHAAEEYCNMFSLTKDTIPTAYGLSGGDALKVYQQRNSRMSAKAAKEFGLLWDGYHRHLVNQGYVDFGDLLSMCNKVLGESEHTLRFYQQRFRHILVDEAQDMNVPEYEFLRLLAADGIMLEKFGGTAVNGCPVIGNELFMVGDPNQAIYGFRGSMAGNLLHSVKRDFPVHTSFLRENYRSHPGIVGIAETLVQDHSKPALFENAISIWKGSSVLSKWASSQPVLVKGFDNEEKEADYIARTAKFLHISMGLEYKDMGVLFRTHAQSRVIEQGCANHQIPYNVPRGHAFWQRAEVKDVVCYLRLMVKPSDVIAFERVINVPSRGLGPKTLEKMKAWAEQQPAGYPASLLDGCLDLRLDALSLEKVLKAPDSVEALASARMPGIEDHNLKLCKVGLTKKALDSLQSFCRLYVALRSTADTLGIVKVVDALLTVGGYEDHLHKGEGNIAKRHDSIRSIKQAAVQLLMYQLQLPQEGPGAGLDALKYFVQEAMLWSDSDLQADDSLTLTSLHSAKGLEFSVVFVAGCEDGMLPHGQDCDPEEEARLAYVGCTRAKDQLYITWARKRLLFGRVERCEPSRFIKHVTEKPGNPPTGAPRQFLRWQKSRFRSAEHSSHI